MRSFLIALFLCVALVGQSQDRGDFLVGLTTESLQDLSFSTSLQYGVTNDIFVGASLNNEDWGASLKGYVGCLHDKKIFGQISYSNDLSLSAGITGLINVFYIEPTLSYTIRDGDDDYGIGVNFGVRF